MPPGRYLATASEFEQRFVNTFPSSATRAKLYGGWRRRREELQSLVLIEQEWIDGSFVTGKSNPQDIDVVTFILAHELEALAIPDRQRVLELTVLDHSKIVFGCDSYLVVAHQEGHPSYDQFLYCRGYWDNWWSRSRTGSQKGYVEVRAE
ncbi:MAG: hypothetical protein HKL84_06090 [Acidimicrobiaceae bacterium]|nr:hypothetical protein [Acidimicrobiaceae bacterium]